LLLLTAGLAPDTILHGKPPRFRRGDANASGALELTDAVVVFNYLFLDGDPNNVHSGDGELFSTPGKKVSQIRNVSMDRQGNLLITENDFGFVRIVFGAPVP
jgi:hypothetical protein